MRIEGVQRLSWRLSSGGSIWRAGAPSTRWDGLVFQALSATELPKELQLQHAARFVGLVGAPALLLTIGGTRILAANSFMTGKCFPSFFTPR